VVAFAIEGAHLKHGLGFAFVFLVFIWTLALLQLWLGRASLRTLEFECGH
jgi:hypothetical protein